MTISRRAFIKCGGVAMIGMSTLPSFLLRAVAAAPFAGRKKLVVVFLRGAADGLNIVVPFGEKNYYASRPSIAIPAPRRGDENATVDLDGFFGLHPGLSSLQPLYSKQQLAIVHAVGSPDATRSHFDAQDYMESGTPGIKSTEDGWLNRSLQEMPLPNASPFRAVAMGANLPRAMRGSAPAVAMADVRQFRVMAPGPVGRAVAGGFEAMYAESVDQALHGTGSETFEAIDMLRKADPTQFPAENGARYPQGKLGQSMQQVAQLHKADIGLEVTFVDVGGWDHHVNEGARLTPLLRELGDSLAAFSQDMGDRMEDVVVVTMSEFGRTARENGNRGTDHGHANCMFLMGGPVRGGKVYGRWPGLATEQLYEGRDLALTTDFRTVLSEVLSRHSGTPRLDTVFPGFSVDSGKYLNLLRV